MIAGLRIIALLAVATLLAFFPGMAQARGESSPPVSIDQTGISMAQARGELSHGVAGADTPEPGRAAALAPPAGLARGGNDAAGSVDCADADAGKAVSSRFRADCNELGANARHTIVFNAAAGNANPTEGSANPTEGGAYPAGIGGEDDGDAAHYNRREATLLAGDDGNAGPDDNRQSSEPPQVFVGITTVNGAITAPGTSITAWDGDLQIGLTTVGEEGAYVLQVARASGEITFQIGSVTANQVYPDWTMGSVITGFDLTAGARTTCLATGPTGHPVLPVLGDLGGEPPHVFIGVARISEQVTPPNTSVTAWDSSRQIGYTTTDVGGAFVLKAGRASGRITFQIGDLIADQTYSGWTLGGVTTGFDLTISGSGVCPEEAVPVAEAVAALGSKFVRAFAFDNDHKEWLFYDPLAGPASTLEHFVPGHSYLILVTESVGVPLNGLQRNLTCVGGNCWNLLVW